MADQNPLIDGITASQPEPVATTKAAPEQTVIRNRMKQVLLIFIGVPYIAYVLWSIVLMVILPEPTGNLLWLSKLGVMLAIGLGLFFLLSIVFGMMRIASVKNISSSQRKKGVLKLILIFLPGLLLSAIVPFMITREPGLPMTLVSPVSAADLVAPLAITVSLEDAVEILKKRGLEAVSYEWDYDQDGVSNEETVVPTATVVFERQGGYVITGKILLNDGSSRKVSKRIVIPSAVFSITPLEPIVNEPVRFSVAHLLLPEDLIKEVKWTFDSNGGEAVTTDEATIVHTFIRTGPTKVIAQIQLQNQSQKTYEKTVTISEPAPLPFPVTIRSEPEHLLSPSPFGAIFIVETKEPYREIAWDFGDGDVATGEKVGHTFTDRGVFRVTAQVKAESGLIATVSKLVRVVETLRIPDLKFDGTPTVNGSRISSEVPLTLNLTPHTSLPLINFFWEAPDATEVGSTETTLQAIYRREGTYTVVLIAEDPEGHAMRFPITVEVKAPSSSVAIKMTPEGGTAPLLVRFDASETTIPGQTITGFEWIFGQGSQASTQQRGAQVEYLFENPGTYTITLRALTTSGESFEGEKTIVVRAPILDACFQPSRTGGSVPLGVKFTNCSTGSLKSISWNFGDGASSDEKDPIHVFEDPGTYNVVLTVEDNNGTVSTESISITAQ